MRIPNVPKWFKFIIVLIVLLLLACGVLRVIAPMFIHVDCGWEGTTKAWVDENQNGVWDNGEHPLAGVQFRVDDIRNDYQDVGDEAISDEQGEAHLFVWLPGCPKVEFEVYAVPLPGHRFTTPSRVPVAEDPLRNPRGGVFTFGFVPED